MGALPQFPDKSNEQTPRTKLILRQQFSFWNPARKQPARGGLFSGFKVESSRPSGANSPL